MNKPHGPGIFGTKASHSAFAWRASAQRIGTRWYILIGLVFLIVALAARARFLGFALPYVYHPDEPNNVVIIHGMLLSHDFNPHAFNYPPFFYYLNFPGQYLTAWWSGPLQPLMMQAGANGIAPQPMVFLAGRATTLIFGLGILPILLLWARTLALGFAALLVLGVMFCLNPLLLRHSTYISPDVFSAFFTAGALAACSLIVLGGRRSVYILAGVMAGLAASSKYNAGLVALSIVAAHVLRDGISLRRAVLLFLAAVAAVLAFLLTSPFIVLDHAAAIDGIFREMQHYRTGHPGNEGATLATNTAWMIGNFGWAGLLVLAAWWTPRRRALVPAALFVIAYFTLVSVQAVRFERNLLPLVPAVLLLVAAGVDGIVRRLARTRPSANPAIGAIAVVLALALFTEPMVASFNAIAYYDPDPRAAARAWLDTILPRTQAKPIAMEPYTPHVDEQGRSVSGVGLVGVMEPQALTKFAFVVLAKEASGRFDTGPYQQARANLAALTARSCARYQFPEGAPQPDFIVLAFACGS